MSMIWRAGMFGVAAPKEPAYGLVTLVQLAQHDGKLETPAELCARLKVRLASRWEYTNERVLGNLRHRAGFPIMLGETYNLGPHGPRHGVFTNLHGDDPLAVLRLPRCWRLRLDARGFADEYWRLAVRELAPSS